MNIKSIMEKPWTDRNAVEKIAFFICIIPVMIRGWFSK